MLLFCGTKLPNEPLEPVSPAPVARQDSTPSALRDVLRKVMEAVFAFVRSDPITPTFVCVFVAFSQVCNGLINLSLSSYPDLSLAASDDLVRSGHQAILYPQFTTTSLPALPADVAVEISTSVQFATREGTRLPELGTATTAGFEVSVCQTEYLRGSTYSM